MRSYFSLIKFSHTIFAMPFALLGFTLGTLQSGAGFSWRTLGLVVLCMIFARSAAMAFNRYLDRDIDELNPRTKVREIPAGVITPRAALFFCNCHLAVVHGLCLVDQSTLFLPFTGCAYRRFGLQLY
jgi:4-hydroxybenzoate polyprenyltransferase